MYEDDYTVVITPRKPNIGSHKRISRFDNRGDRHDN